MDGCVSKHPMIPNFQPVPKRDSDSKNEEEHMKKNTTTKQKLKLSRETLRRLEAHQLGEVVGGTTDATCPVTFCYPCQPSREIGGCTEDP